MSINLFGSAHVFVKPALCNMRHQHGLQMLIADAVRLLYVTTKPLLLSGGCVQMTTDVLDEVQRQSALLSDPVANTYLHDCFPVDDAKVMMRR